MLAPARAAPPEAAGGRRPLQLAVAALATAEGKSGVGTPAATPCRAPSVSPADKDHKLLVLRVDWWGGRLQRGACEVRRTLCGLSSAARALCGRNSPSCSASAAPFERWLPAASAACPWHRPAAAERKSVTAAVALPSPAGPPTAKGPAGSSPATLTSTCRREMLGCTAVKARTGRAAPAKADDLPAGEIQLIMPLIHNVTSEKHIEWSHTGWRAVWTAAEGPASRSRLDAAKTIPPEACTRSPVSLTIG